MQKIENEAQPEAPGELRDRLIKERGGRPGNEGEGGATTTWREAVEGRQESTHPSKPPKDGINRRG